LIAEPHTQIGDANLWQALSDLDGDGNDDLVFNGGSVSFGRGVKNNLLSRVEDGLGNFVTVEYDQASHTTTFGRR
jgi:hypothetical protein